jgi:hypothetical protein
MRNKGLTARPAARKGTVTRTKKTVAVASRKSQPIIQMVERKSSRNILEAVDQQKKLGELPIPSSTFVF